ncbi:MAG: hypothetical protein ABMA25_08945 [Ilumatobacteraceae bacterium]
MLVSLIIGIAFLVVAWHPPEPTESRDSASVNRCRSSWRKPRLLPNATGRIAQAALAVGGVLVLVDAIVDALR